MDLYDILSSARNERDLRSIVDALCKGRELGESLTPSMLHCMLESLEPWSSVFAGDIAAIKQEIKILEDPRSINRRKRAYGIDLLLTKTRLPEPAKDLILAGFLPAPDVSSRPSPSKFTLTQEFQDAAGAAWTWAPYTAEAWRGHFK